MKREEFDKLLEAHYRAYYKDSLKFVLSKNLPRYIADEVVQEAYTRALEFWQTYDETVPFDKWFTTILKNCKNKAWKQERQHGGVEEAEYEDEPVAIKRLMLRDIERMIYAQDKDIVPTLVLFFIKQLNAEEISYLVPKSKRAIDNIVHRFRLLIRKELDRVRTKRTYR